MASAAPTNDCDIPASKEQAVILRGWALELARAVNYAIATSSVLEALARQCGAAWAQGDGAQAADILERARVILDMQKMALSRDGVKPGNRGIPQGWSDALKLEESDKERFKKSMLAASFVKATEKEDAKLGEKDAEGAAELIWDKREQTLPGSGVVETKRPDTPDSDCKD